MPRVDEYAQINRAWWDERAPAHAASPDYGVVQLTSDPAYLSDVVRFDVPRLGDLTGLDAVHLQCHIGTDTVSLARLGARITGVDISPPAIAEARKLAASLGIEATFVESEVYDAVEALGGERFDLVFTGIGALCWLPDIRRWADVVAGLLRPGGRLHIREAHPVLWSLDTYRKDGQLVLRYPYFEVPEALVIDEGPDVPGTYVETDVEFTVHLTHEWNHGLGEIVTALLAAGMELTLLEEHDSVPWKGVESMVEIGGGEWQVPDRPERLPHTYTLQARKRA